MPITHPADPSSLFESARSSGAVDLNELISAAQAGDRNACNEIWDQLRGYLLLIADKQLTGSLRRKFGASDIVQQSLIEAQFDFDSFIGDANALRAWLRKLVENNITDAWRRFAKNKARDVSREVALHEAGQCDDGQLTASRICCRHENDLELLQAVQALSPQRQKLIEMRHRGGLSFAAIGTAMGISEGAARQLWLRTIDELREKLR